MHRKKQIPKEASLKRFLVRCHLDFDQSHADLEAMFDSYIYQSIKFGLRHLHKIIEGT